MAPEPEPPEDQPPRRVSRIRRNLGPEEQHAGDIASYDDDITSLAVIDEALDELLDKVRHDPPLTTGQIFEVIRNPHISKPLTVRSVEDIRLGVAVLRSEVDYMTLLLATAIQRLMTVPQAPDGPDDLGQ
jgi:hypothetical protein